MGHRQSFSGSETDYVFLFLISLAAASPLSSGGNSSALAAAAANCDPDYGWIDGPEGTNKCYMYLKDQAYSACFPGGGGYPDYNCDPANPNCYLDCYDSYCCQDPYACGGGTYYTSFNWFEAQQCCVQNHGFLAEPASQEEHDLIKQHLVIIDGADACTSYWLGGSDFYEEGTFQWANGDPFTFTQWGEGEPNNSGDEDCIAMSSRNSYNWLDLNCAQRDHSSEMHYAVCENRKG